MDEIKPAVHTTKSVLLIEDDATLSDAFSMMLDMCGYNVRCAFNGKEALDLLQTFTPDIILLDLLMPIMDGREFLQAFPNHQHLPILVFSNLDSKSVVEEVLALGASRYMLKSSVTPTLLNSIIDEMLSGEAKA